MGMTVAQARCLILIREGYISFEEAFDNNVLFGVYSQTKIIDSPVKVENACAYIDKLYLEFLRNRHSQDHLRFIKKYVTEDSPPTCILTREQAHLDLQEVYGGESDTDDEGYESDLVMSS